mmetsp:Transcript_50772/g.75904  ORF Transcript_50772/g.75904 Transcript_50772/m.75904 type:complete len:141 (+) Transcript_50772:395-817(+)
MRERVDFDCAYGVRSFCALLCSLNSTCLRTGTYTSQVHVQTDGGRESESSRHGHLYRAESNPFKIGYYGIVVRHLQTKPSAYHHHGRRLDPPIRSANQCAEPYAIPQKFVNVVTAVMVAQSAYETTDFLCKRERERGAAR